MKTKTQKEEALRARMLTKAREKFFTLGIERVTMDELSKELRISKKTLYGIFPSKTSLLEAVVMSTIDGVNARLRVVMATKSGYEKKLAGILEIVQGVVRQASPVWLKDMAEIHADLFERLKKRRRRLVEECFEKLIMQAREENGVKWVVPEKTVVQLLVALFDTIVVPGKLLEMKMRPDEAIGIISQMIFKGLAA
jgi:AcrR family transcriptional regulator